MTRVTLHAPFAAWSGPLSEVPDEAFAQGLLGEGFALDPLHDTVCAPFDSEVIALAPTGHAVTLRHSSGAEVLLHVGIDTVVLKGRGFEPLVQKGTWVKVGEPLLRIDLDLLAREARSLVSPLVLVGSNQRLEHSVTGRTVSLGEVIGEVVAGPAVRTDEATDTIAISRTVSINLPHGLHARPSARIVAALHPFAAQVFFSAHEKVANARSVTALLKLDVRCGDLIEIEARGQDADQALDSLEALLATDMDETSVAKVLDVAAPQFETDGIRGLRAASGGALGFATRLQSQDISLPETTGSISEETAALAMAMAALSERLRAQSADTDIAKAHLALLTDPDIYAQVERRLASGEGAASAWRSVSREEMASLQSTGNPLLAERAADLLDVERQLISLLLGTQEAVPDLPLSAILIADELLPSTLYSLDTSRLTGIATARGGPTSHVAILAAARGVPMIVACGPQVLEIENGTQLLIEADQPFVHVAPDDATLCRWAATNILRHEQEKRALSAAQANCCTADGIRIEVFANCGSAQDAMQAVERGAEGCGLLRSEFLFLGRPSAPSPEEQAEAYRTVAEALGGRPLIVRTLDAGSDKPLPYLPLAAEENPALGLRGIRLTLAMPHLLTDQFEAILLGVPASQRHIMLPMVSDLTELRAAATWLRECEKRLGGVDKFEPVSGGGDMDHTEEAVGKLVIARGDGAVDLQMAEHALDAVALLVERPVVFDLHTTV